MKVGKEDVFRRALWIGAFTSWMVAISLTLGVYYGVLDVLKGWGLVTNMCLAMAITLSVVWAQFRIRRVITNVFDAGIRVQREIEAERREREDGWHQHHQ